MSFTRYLVLALGLLCAPLAIANFRIVVSVDWEGRNLDPENLEAMRAFRSDYPAIPLEHFLNAAYFTKPKVDPVATEAAIRSVLREGDEQGLHIHAWKSLVEAAGVHFRTEPAFKGYFDASKCDPDCGHDINLASYNEAELRKLLRFSIKTLGKHGFKRPVSFRAGAWQAEQRTLSALAAEGFTLDSSATYAEYLKERWGHTLLYPVTAKIWPNITPTSQPYTIELGQGRKILELPNNGCLADYMTGEAILKAFRANVELWKKKPDGDTYLSIGFHQETAKKFLPQLRAGIDAIIAEAKAQNIPIEFVVPPLTIH